MTILCSVRGKSVAATPEEKVRQKLIAKMIFELGFPKGLIAVEREISPSTGRRLDLICYASKQEGLVPLLIAECKAVRLNEAALRQALGYNSFLGAPFVCIASENELFTFWKTQGKIDSVPFLPSYAELCKICC